MTQDTRSHLINGQPSRLVNSDLHNFDSGAESAAALQPRATPWVSESIGAPCKGGTWTRTRPRGVAPGWHAPRRWRVIVAKLSIGENCHQAIYEVASVHIAVKNVGSLLPRRKT